MLTLDFFLTKHILLKRNRMLHSVPLLKTLYWLKNPEISLLLLTGISPVGLNEFFNIFLERCSMSGPSESNHSLQNEKPLFFIEYNK